MFCMIEMETFIGDRKPAALAADRDAATRAASAEMDRDNGIRRAAAQVFRVVGFRHDDG